MSNDNAMLHLIFFVLLMITILSIKKIFQPYKQIIINGIWFSGDGSIPEDAVNNFVQLAKKIKKSPYKQFYQLYFWADVGKIENRIKRTLHRHGVVLKDYRDIHPKDEISKISIEYVNFFISQGDQNSKYFYCLASDLFRLYLLCKEFPENYKNAVTCYIDCNDISILDVPSPKIFEELNLFAFNFVNLHHEDVLIKLIGSDIEPQPHLNNDVMIVANKRNKNIRDLIFKTYYENLIAIDRTTGGLKEMLIATKNATQNPDKNLALVIVFAITHMTNIFRFNRELLSDPFLCVHDEKEVKTQILKDIQVASYFLSFEREEDKGMTWIGEHIIDDQLLNSTQKFWYELFAKRYREITDAVQSIQKSSDPVYTVDWFSYHIENWNKWLNNFKDKPALRFLEIGCFEGRSTRWLLENILTHASSKIFCIDLFGRLDWNMDTIKKRFYHNIKKYVDKVSVFIQSSQEALRKESELTSPDLFDFIYIDGSHDACDVLEDAILSFRLLKSGGVLVFDDYKLKLYKNSKLNPKAAIDAWLACFEGQYEMVHKAWQVCVIKR